jgi:hypothetical protein
MTGTGGTAPPVQSGFLEQVIISNQQSGTLNFRDNEESPRITEARRGFAKDSHLRKIVLCELIGVALIEVVRDGLALLVQNSNILREI